MTIRSLLHHALLLTLATSPALAKGVSPDPTGATSTFTVVKRTQIPGGTLAPGDYSIQILDHLTDRMIVRVEQTSGKDRKLFLAVPASLGISEGQSGALAWKQKIDGLPALRGFKFASGYVAEFVYPKAQAAELAKANKERVVAVDPESEGRPSMQHLSSEDLQMVNLWMLSLTTAGPETKTPAILAQRYQALARPDGVQVAEKPATVNPTAPSVSARQVQVPDTRVAKLEQPQIGGQHTAPVATRPRHSAVIKILPHTASYLPLLMLAGLFSALLFLAFHFGLQYRPYDVS